MSDSILSLGIAPSLKQPEQILEILCQDYIDSDDAEHKLPYCQDRVAVSAHCITIVPNPTSTSGLRFFLSSNPHTRHLRLIWIAEHIQQTIISQADLIHTGVWLLSCDWQIIDILLQTQGIQAKYSQDPQDFVDIQLCLWAIKLYSDIQTVTMCLLPSSQLWSLTLLTRQMPESMSCLIQAHHQLHKQICQVLKA